MGGGYGQEAMDNYFLNARTTLASQSMLPKFQLQCDAKLLWKQHYRDSAVAENSQSWKKIRQAVQARYTSDASSPKDE